MTKHSSTTRFSNRVEDYIRYRPHYPAAILQYLHEQVGLDSTYRIADIGSGTGISTELFLRNGNMVCAVEPNREMRVAAEKLLSHYNNFMSVDGTAENTHLKEKDIDLIVAGQAFHWFDIEKSRAEAMRILKPGGYVALLWNDRSMDADEFAREYEALLITLTDYNVVNHRNTDAPAFDRFFGKDNYTVTHFENYQDLDLEGLKGRLMSSSYAPVPPDPAHASMMSKLEQMFARHNRDGIIRLRYDTKLVLGRLQG